MKKRRPSKRTASPNLLRTLLGLFVLASLSYWIAGALDSWELDLHWDRHIQSPLSFDDETILVTEVKPEASSAGLAKGIKITGLNGAPYSGTAQWAEILVTAHPGDTLDVEFDRPNGTHGIATITLTERKRAHSGIADWAVLTRDGIFSLLPLICLFIGFWVVAAKPLDINAWLLLILLAFPEVLTMDLGMATGTGLLLRGVWYQTMQILASPALLLFGVYFPERSRIDQKLPWVKWLIVGPILAFLGLVYPYWVRLYFLGGISPLWARTIDLGLHIVNVLNLACVVLYLVLTLDKLRSASTADARRRLRVLTVGMSVGVGSLLFVFILLPHFGFKRDTPAGFWILSTGAILFMIAPLTLAYVVLVQRAMDVRTCLHVHGDDIGAGLGERFQIRIAGRDHQMHVEHFLGVAAQRFYRIRADRDVGHEVAVHHVDMDPIGAGRIHRAYFLAELGEVRRQDRRGDDEWALHRLLAKISYRSSPRRRGPSNRIADVWPTEFPLARE